MEWEGRRYRVNAARAEELRLHRVRQRQGGVTLGPALQGVLSPQKAGGDRVLADTLTSILYAAYLGDPQGPAVIGGNVALRHELGTVVAIGPRMAWRLPTEGHTSKGWKVTGSLLGLDLALARLSLRRLDSTVMPPEPQLVSAERQTVSTSVALLNPGTLTDATRDEIAAALARGRARLDALDGSEADLEQVAKDAGLSAWRREALRWTIAHDSTNRAALLSVVELMWLGRPRVTAAIALDPWGAATLPLNGCACLVMPPPAPWERLSGRPAQGLLATRGADVSIVVADTLASLGLPSQIAPGVIAYAAAGSHRPGAAGTYGRLVRIQPRRQRALARQPRRLHCRANRWRSTPAGGTVRRPTRVSASRRWSCRTACCSWSWPSPPAAP